jgi:hypothetical protein
VALLSFGEAALASLIAGFKKPSNLNWTNHFYQKKKKLDKPRAFKKVGQTKSI